MNKPIEISESEWNEIIQLREVREGWGLENETGLEFAEQVYGVKFNFHSGSPGYVGDLFIIQGDGLTGDASTILIRENGTLRVQ